jgi:hypothetical protein
VALTRFSEKQASTGSAVLFRVMETIICGIRQERSVRRCANASFPQIICVHATRPRANFQKATKIYNRSGVRTAGESDPACNWRDADEPSRHHDLATK